MLIFIYKWLKKCRFRTLVRDWRDDVRPARCKKREKQTRKETRKKKENSGVGN
jgi:hypothetical protein